MHLQESRKFLCHLCGYRAKIRGNLTLHLRNTHKVNVVTKPHKLVKVRPDGTKVSPKPKKVKQRLLVPVEEAKLPKVNVPENVTEEVPVQPESMMATEGIPSVLPAVSDHQVAPPLPGGGIIAAASHIAGVQQLINADQENRTSALDAGTHLFHIPAGHMTLSPSGEKQTVMTIKLASQKVYVNQNAEANAEPHPQAQAPSQFKLQSNTVDLVTPLTRDVLVTSNEGQSDHILGHTGEPTPAVGTQSHLTFTSSAGHIISGSETLGQINSLASTNHESAFLNTGSQGASHTNMSGLMDEHDISQSHMTSHATTLDKPSALNTLDHLSLVNATSSQMTSALQLGVSDQTVSQKNAQGHLISHTANAGHVIPTTNTASHMTSFSSTPTQMTSLASSSHVTSLPSLPSYSASVGVTQTGSSMAQAAITPLADTPGQALPLHQVTSLASANSSVTSLIDMTSHVTADLGHVVSTSHAQPVVTSDPAATSQSPPPTSLHPPSLMTLPGSSVLDQSRPLPHMPQSLEPGREDLLRGSGMSQLDPDHQHYQDTIWPYAAQLLMLGDSNNPNLGAQGNKPPPYQ